MMLYLTDTVSGQAGVFLLSVGAGALLGVIYDLFKLLRIALPAKKTAVFIEDVLFWSLASVFSFTFILIFNSGEIRGFILFGEAAGFIVYRFLFSPALILLLTAIVDTIKKTLMLVFRILKKIVIEPILLILGIMTRPFRVLFVHTKQKIKKSWKNWKNILQRRTYVLYNNFRHIKKRGSAYRRSSPVNEKEELEKEFYP